MTGAEPASEPNSAVPDRGYDALEDAVRSIGGHAQAANLARAQHLADAVADSVGLSVDEARRRAANTAHQIAGSAGTFGFPRASHLAAELERLLLGGELDRDQLEIIRGHVQALLTDLNGEPTY